MPTPGSNGSSGGGIVTTIEDDFWAFDLLPKEVRGFLLDLDTPVNPSAITMLKFGRTYGWESVMQQARAWSDIVKQQYREEMQNLPPVRLK